MELPITEPGDEDRYLRSLARRSSEGNADAFNELAARLLRRIQLWARRFTGSSDDADDVAQVVLMRLHARAHEFEGRSRITSWLYRITRNVANDRRQLEGRRASLLSEHVAQLGNNLEVPAVANPDAATLARLVRAYHAELTGRQREVFDLADLQGLTAAEIAERMNVKPVTVRVTLMQARRAIRLKMLSEHPRLLEEYKS